MNSIDGIFKPELTALSRKVKRSRRLQRIALEAWIERHPWCDGIYDPQVVNEILAPRGTTADTSREYSQNIWGNCPWQSLKSGNRHGFAFEDDFFMAGNADMTSAYVNGLGQWSVYGYAGATLDDGQLEGGVIKIGSNGDNEGVALLSSAGSCRFITTSTLAPNPRMWFEARWAKSTITTDRIDVFVGLMKPTLSSALPAAAQPITATDDTLMTAGDLFGFHSCSNTAVRGGMTEIASAFVLASGTVNYPTNQTTMLASTGNSVLSAAGYVKTGWRFDPNGPFKRVVSATARQTAGQVKRAVIRFYLNNLELPSFLTSDDVYNATATQAFPTAFMCPTLAVMNTDASSNTLNVDWIRCAQEALT